LASLITPSVVRTQETKHLQPPKTTTGDVKELIHGVEIADPYRWLEDQQTPETRAWIDAQNKYSRALLDSRPGREALKRRLTELMKIETVNVPTERNGKYFFKRRSADQDQGVLYMRVGADGKDKVLVDPNPLSPDRNISAGFEDVSKDGMLVAYSLRHGGEDETTVHLLEVSTRTELPDQLPSVAISLSQLNLTKAVSIMVGQRRAAHASATTRWGATPPKTAKFSATAMDLTRSSDAICRRTDATSLSMYSTVQRPTGQRFTTKTLRSRSPFAPS